MNVDEVKIQRSNVAKRFNGGHWGGACLCGEVVCSGERRVCLCAAGSSLGSVGVGVYRFLGSG